MLISLLLSLQLMAQDTSSHESWVPNRVYDAHHKQFSDFESLLDAAAASDVVFLGEQHDDVSTHRMELALLQGIARRRRNVVVSLEMFERDVQPLLDRYLAGSISEEEFLKASRPWPRYATDYRPLIEFARAHQWHVIAANIPRPMASAVSHNGLDALTALHDSTRPWAAREFDCPMNDDYHRRFLTAMGDHPASPGMPSNDNMYRAQCVKDETMAESIARAHRDGTAPLVIQYNGDFHSDFGEGTAERVRHRIPGARVMVISAVPVPTLVNVDAKSIRKQGDWILFVLKAN